MIPVTVIPYEDTTTYQQALQYLYIIHASHTTLRIFFLSINCQYSLITLR